jgi:amidase
LYLDRIETIDKNGLELHSIIEVNSKLAIAKTMDAEMKGVNQRPFTRYTVVIKDIDTADKMQTTAGSLALEGNFAERCFFVVET